MYLHGISPLIFGMAPACREQWSAPPDEGMKVAVFGLGYVGTVTAACLAANGHDVWGVDTDEFKVAAVSAGHSPVVEPGLEALLAQSVSSGTLHATTEPLQSTARC